MAYPTQLPSPFHVPQTQYEMPGLVPASSIADTHIPMLITESRLQNTEVRLSLSKITDKLDTVIEKVNEMQLQGRSSAFGSAAFMDSTLLVQNIERIVQENHQLKEDAEAKNTKIQSLNEIICDLLQRNRGFFEESNSMLEQRSDSIQAVSTQSQAKLLNLEKEKANLLSELTNATSKMSAMESELKQLQSQENQLKLRLQEFENSENQSKESSAENESLVNSLQEHMNNLKEENIILKSKLEDLEKQLEELSKHNTSLTKQSEESELKIREIESKAARQLKEMKESLHAVVFDSNSEIQTLRTENERISMEKEKLLSEAEALKLKLKNSEVNSEKLIQDLQDQIEEALIRKKKARCKEEDDGTPIGEINKYSNFRPTLKKEFIRKNPIFMEGVPGATPVADPNLVTHVQQKSRNMCGWNKSGFPGSQPVSMDINNLKFLHSKPYKVSWKADGTRYMMLIDGADKIYFIDQDNSIFKVEGLTFPRRKDPDQHIGNTLLDGVMVIDKMEGYDMPRYLVYDIVKFEDQDIRQVDFDRRLACITKEIIGPRKAAIESGKLDQSKEPFSVKAKDFWDIPCVKQILGEKFKKDLTHGLDGLVFQPVSEPYVCGLCFNVLKWKPANLNSVDFKLVIEKRTGFGLLPTKVGLLYVGGMSKPFAEIKITEALKDMDKKIIECKHENNQWLFMRERTNKSFPNDYKTAKRVCESIRNPVTTELLFHHIDCYGWRPPKNDLITADILFHTELGELVQNFLKYSC